MTRAHTRRRLGAVAAAVLLPLAAAAQSGSTGETPAVEPFTGRTGYQELALGPDRWYLAFHGSRQHAPAAVEAAWLARATQLCRTAGKTHVVELRYIDEPVYDAERVAVDDGAAMVRVKGGGYVPIFIPGGSSGVIQPDLTPSKAAPLRCVDQTFALRAGKTAVPVGQ